jgi:hypothetical protein
MNVAMDVWPHCNIGSGKNQRTGEARLQEWIRLVIHHQHERPQEQEKQVIDGHDASLTLLKRISISKL